MEIWTNANAATATEAAAATAAQLAASNSHISLTLAKRFRYEVRQSIESWFIHYYFYFYFSVFGFCELHLEMPQENQFADNFT